MPIEDISTPIRRIAVVGGGISGLAASYLLKDCHHVTLFEAERRLGGHARTVLAGRRGDQPVDTGFIVFNKVNYPNLTRMFDDLRVSYTPSNMSFGVSARRGRLEYALNSFDSIFAQRRNVVDPRFLRMLRDILHFNKRARDVAREGMRVGDLLGALGTGTWFRDYYLLPFSGAIWSTPTRGILDFPAHALVRFFENHALLGYEGQHEWHTIKGGSAEYVRRMARVLTQAGVDLRPGVPVREVRRSAGRVEVVAEGYPSETFDEVIFATHSDTSLSLLADASDAERAALGAVRYQPNRAVLHADPSVMPRRRKCWASWVYSESEAGAGDRIGLSYWMNSLQPIPGDDPLFVTLNGSDRIDPARIHDEVTFTHPVYDGPALRAQEDIRGFNGTRSTWFCGAWMRSGFHEDGFASARDVVEAMAARDAAPVAAQ